MGIVGVLMVDGMALLFSVLLFFVPVRGKRHPPQESFEDSQERIEQYLREMRKNRGGSPPGRDSEPVLRRERDAVTLATGDDCECRDLHS
jgi:hypothetical protein